MNGMTVRRIITNGAKNFGRGGAVSVATVLIMTVTLAIIGALIFFSALLTYTLNGIKDKVDVSVYFVNTASEADIMNVESQLQQLPQVESVSYISASQALADFRTRYANDELTLQALDELGGNPLDASLEIRAKDPSQYQSIVDFINASPMLSVNGTSIVDHVNYAQNKQVIDRLTQAMHATRDIGLVIVLVFAIASVLIAFATIRLAIYTARDEIAVMRLVGASNAYTQGPFIVAGVITGVVASVLVLLLLWPVTWYAASRTASWLGGFDFAAYYGTHFPLILAIILGSGIVLGALASVLAIRRYLRV